MGSFSGFIQQPFPLRSIHPGTARQHSARGVWGSGTFPVKVDLPGAPDPEDLLFLPQSADNLHTHGQQDVGVLLGRGEADGDCHGRMTRDVEDGRVHGQADAGLEARPRRRPRSMPRGHIRCRGHDERVVLVKGRLEGVADPPAEVDRLPVEPGEGLGQVEAVDDGVLGRRE